MMRKRSNLALAVTIATAFFIFYSPSAQAYQFKSTGTIDVYFSPNGGVTKAIASDQRRPLSCKGRKTCPG
jgi:hypothetical protein